VIDEMELAAFADFVASAVAEDRETGVIFVDTVVFAEPVMLGLEERGAFLMASDIEARGRAAGAVAFAEPTEPVGEVTVVRRGEISGAGFALEEADNDCLTVGGAGVFVGATDALRLDTAATTGGLADAEEVVTGLELAGGADVVGFLNGGAVAFEATVAGAGVTAFVPVGLTDPAPNVPELMI
jgi:hypothetical protein